MAVHVVGNACIDTSFTLARFPLPGESLNAVDFTEGLGGKGLNQAVAAARTGARVHFWAAIGADPGGDWIVRHLASELDTFLLVRKDLPTDRSTILIDVAGENMVVTAGACAAAFDPASETPLSERIEAGDIVVMQGNALAQGTGACLRMARERGARTILNASPLHGVPDLAAVDFVIVNEGEAVYITGQTDPLLAARQLSEDGTRTALVTLGSRGCLLVEGNDCRATSIAAPKVGVVDTSGAGDVFCGVFAGRMGLGFTAEPAARLAVFAAAVSVGRRGTLASCPSRQEIDGILKRMETLTA